MIQSYLRSTLRLLVKDRLYVFINALGLAIGLATCFLIFSWVQFETSFDTQYPNYDRIYRVVTDWDESSEPGMATTYPMVRTRVLSQFPEVETSARLFNQGFLGSKTLITTEGRVFTDTRFFYADSTYLTLFGFHMEDGNPATALLRPNTVVLTRSAARKFFGHEPAVGKMIRVGKDRDMEVTGVMEDLPPNTHTHFDALASMRSHPWIKNAENSVWSGIVFHTYVRLQPGASPVALEEKVAKLLDNFPDDPEHVGKGLDLRLQPVADIHLTSNRKFELEANGNNTYVYLFVSIAILVLLVAMVNYTNLATARHMQRFKEVGIRKVLGASRKQLVTQLMTESLMITSLAFVIAALLAEGGRPLLMGVTGQTFFAQSFLQPRWLGMAAAIAFLVGLLTGVSPAWALSSIEPARLFRPTGGSISRGISTRKLLLVSQFTISIALTICTAITYKQVMFLRDTRLGFQPDHTLVLDVNLPGIREKIPVLKSEVLRHPDVLGATATSQLPTDIQTAENIDVTSSQSQGVYCVSVDVDFFRVMGIPVRQGETLIQSLQPNDSMNRFVFNQQALNAVGWTEEDASGKLISIRHGNQKPGPVMGVVDDFHFQSLHHTIGPLVFEFNPDSYQYLLVKVKPERLTETLRFLSDTWNTLAEGIPFEYQFLDQQYNNLYRSEQQSGSLFIVFAALAIFISMLGLFGLSSFAMERRTREMGMRKILGADAIGVILLVIKDFLVLILVAFVIAVPLGYLFEQNWLTSFAFRTEIGAGLFLICGLLNGLLAVVTLLYHGIRISRMNPVDTLRYE
ncbi:MAG: ABC transporter permease [Cyclobacteriaceae bacterium]|nr:ABC transporter permease [Cyclobacteriaceae bacterium]